MNCNHEWVPLCIRGMRFGSVCSGIEAASVAWGPLGWEAAWFAEIEPFPCATLAYHYPTVPNLGDMTTLPGRILQGEVEAPDLLCGGTPCQAFSVAGLRKSLDDARGNLSLTFCEIANAIDAVRSARGSTPAIVFWENVPGVLTTADNAFGCFLAGLAGHGEPLVAPGGKWTNAGAVLGPQRAVAWRILDAQYFGLAQRRRRVFVVASARDGFDPASVLFEFEGVRRDSAPSREAGQKPAPTVAGCANGGGANGPGRDVDSADSLVVRAPDLARCITTREGTSQDYETTTMAAHSLRADGFDTSEDGTGRGTPLVPVPRGSHWDSPANPHPTLNQSAKSSGGIAASDQELFSQRGAGLVPAGVTLHGTDGTTSVASITDLSSSLRARIPSGVENSTTTTTTAVLQPIGFNAPQDPDAWVGRTGPLDTDGRTLAVAFSSKDYGGDATSDLSPTLRAMPHDGSHANGGGQMAVAIHENQRAELTLNDTAGAMKCAGGKPGQGYPAAMVGMQVRRLTPRECERLQGFPDDYTNIPSKVVRDTGAGPCFKQTVTATVVAKNGTHFVSTNHCDTPQDHCPRGDAPSGTGYELCRAICNQRSHAEINAVLLAGKHAKDGVLYVEGHDRVCQECVDAAKAAGIKDILLGKPPGTAADGPRYKALGNSWAVPVVRWIGRRIDAAIDEAMKGETK